METRHADPARDGAACAAIYAPSVTAGIASFEQRAPSAAEMAGRIAQISEDWPWLVAEREGAVVGYAYASRHRERSAYRWAADVTVYVAEGQQRQGIGRRLYEPLLALLVAQGLYAALAGIALPNPGSVRLHESFGFEPVGVYRAIGHKGGAWRDVGWWQKTLRAPIAGEPPAEPSRPRLLSELDA